MMKCCIKNCGNNEKLKKISQSSTSVSERITFHLFPRDPKQRVSWLEALAIPNWVPTNRTVICSDHFKEEDFYFTKQGIRRIKYGVIPFIEDDSYGAAALRICRLCLSLDGKMYRLQNYGLDKMYQDIMGKAPCSDTNNRLPMGVCWECTARLQSAASFRSKALFSDALLQDHLKNNTDLKISDILNIHRQHTNLKSTWTVQEVFKFHSNNVEEHAPNTLIKTEVIGIPHNEEIEIEVQNLIADKVTIKDERSNEIIVETYHSADVKTEIDLIPITEIESGEKETDLEDYDDNDIGSENMYDNDAKLSFDKVVLFQNEEEIETLKCSNSICDSDDDVEQTDPCKSVDGAVEDQITVVDDVITVCGDDDDRTYVNDDTPVANEAVVCTEKKTIELRKTKVAVKRKPENDDDVIISVKAGPKKKKQPCVKPAIPTIENTFIMKPLDHEELRQELLDRRTCEKYTLAPYKCDVCYRGFPTKDKQQRHMIKHSEKSGSIKCNICHFRMKKMRDLGAHMKGQHTLEFICKLCPLVTRNRNAALVHTKYHAGSKYKCPQCSVEFERPTTLLSHQRLKHLPAYVCQLCGYTFVSETGVQIHKRMKHKFFDKNAEFQGPYCDVCDVKFLTEKAYARHLLLSSKHIKEDDPNRMSNDPSKTQRPLGLSSGTAVRQPGIHLRNENSMQTRKGPVTCEQCGVLLVSRQVYVTHFKKAHPGINRTQFTAVSTSYMCEHCGKFFLNTTTLAGHMWVHTGQKWFQCDHCNKTFSTKGSVAAHMQQHAPDRRKYDCVVCGKHFSSGNNLTRHMFLHTGLRPFKCDFCEKSFPTSGELRSHVDHVHLKKPRKKRVRRKGKKREMSSDAAMIC